MEWLTTSTILDGLSAFENDAAWHRLDGRFREPVVRFARRTGLAVHEAEDLAQDVLLAFAESYRQGNYDRERGRLSGWLFGIAYNHIRRQRQKTARRDARLEPGQPQTHFFDQLPDERDARTAWEQDWESSLWNACLGRIRTEFEPETVTAFELSLRGERKPADVARDLGIPVKAVYNARHRVLKRLRELRSEFEDVL